jgi:hypothetical protein
MARLIPSFMDDRTPAGERDVFNMLAAGPDDWIALHSLDLAPWNRGLRTEIDFLVIVPDTGMLCIEVKSHDTISFDDDKWNPPEIKRSPFKQAADGRHTFYRRLRELEPQFRQIPVVHCCIFPNASFELQPNLSVQRWELVDARIFRSFARASDFCADLKVRMSCAINADANLQKLNVPLSVTQINTIVKSCLPIQRRRPSAREEIQRREEEVNRLLRDQQKPVLELAALNKRVIVNGAAGTGKTLIAMEVAKHAADSGRRVGLLCFNQLVGDWMQQQIKSKTPSHPNLLVGRAIRVLAEMSGVSIPENPSSEFWSHDLPERLEERLTDPEFRAVATFDYLVVDEAQDLLARPRLWDAVTCYLERGVTAGGYCLFGDFENQVVGDRSKMEQSLSSLQAATAPTRYRLSENCRNYRIIGDSAVRLSGFERPVYSGYMRVGGGIQNYDISFYADEREQQVKLAQWLRDFRAQGYTPAEISVLSFRTTDNSAATQLAKSGFNLRPAWQHSRESTSYASVQAFKGLENMIIILTDIALNDADFQRDLFYTGMTRARESVRVLCHTGSQQTLTGWLTGRHS